MIVGAHVAGIPVEELLPSVTGLLAARAWMMFHVRRRRKPDE
jgi:hypothetical protein